MPITINGSAGTITGVSTGGLPDGCVDTDTLANNAVTSAKSTGLQRRISTGPTDLSGSSIAHTVTAGVKKIEIILSNFSATSDTNMELELGDAGGFETSGYNYAMGFHRGSSTGKEASVSNATGAFSTYGLDSAGYNVWGTWKLWNPTGNTWIAEHIFWGDSASNHQFFGNGYKELSDTITQLRLIPFSGTFDSGSWTIVETMGDT